MGVVTAARASKVKPADLTDEQIAEMFPLHFDKGLSLSEIGRRYDTGWYTVRRILSGEREAERTAALRALYPAYDFERTRSKSLDDEQIARLFRLYHVAGMSVSKLAAEFGVAQATVRDHLTGQVAAAQTEQLRAEYGDKLRPPGAAPGEHRPKRKAG